MIGIATLAAFAMAAAAAQQPVAASADAAAIIGTVVDSAGKPVPDASVLLLAQQPGAVKVVAKTDAKGAFTFRALHAGTYLVSAEKAGLHSRVATTSASPAGGKQIEIMLPSSLTSGGRATSAEAMDFADQPNFTVAGVTDWTAVGGHGSDAVLRTSEELARDTATLKPANSDPTGVSSPGASNQAAEHRLAGEIAEKSGDPLQAVHEYEQAVRLDPSEQNYFDWGSELLLHRAVWQAVEVFGNGSKAYPKSARMLAALGAALFASARYDDAALRLCSASNLDPKASEPYVFLGKIAIAAPAPLPCVEKKLAQFVELRPDNSLANYLYAMALLKGQEQSSAGNASGQVEALLTRAVKLDPKCADGWLQLGIQASSVDNIQKAIEFYRKAIEVNPQLGEAHYRLGVAYDRIGESSQARDEFQLHDEIERREAVNVERERREVKQFLVVLQGQPTVSPAR
jgi:tetratricopeptide (TPR) repeat protein